MSDSDLRRGRSAASSLPPSALATADESTFGRLVERHRRELQVYCYRMLGSFEDSEDLVQETLLRAWRNRASFQGRSTLRTWLYRIATNACLDALDRRPRRLLPTDVVPAWSDTAVQPGSSDMPAQQTSSDIRSQQRSPNMPGRQGSGTADLLWLQPYPDRLLDTLASTDSEPAAAVVDRETMELTFIAAIQYLPPRQRAVVILSDVLEWSASESAALLDMSVAAVKSALQRARATLRTHLPARRLEWSPGGDPSRSERLLVRRFMDAFERADVAAIAELLTADARMSMPPLPLWYDGRAAIVDTLRVGFSVFGPDDIRAVASAANRQPTVALYFREPGQSRHRAIALHVLRLHDGAIAELFAFYLPAMEWLPQAFHLPASL